MTSDRRAYLRTYQAAWIARRRAAWIASQGGRCVRCGSTEWLEVDHIDHKSKAANPKHLWSRQARHAAAELAKCQVLCWACHRAKTTRERYPLTDEQVEVIRHRLTLGESKRRLAREFRVSSNTIYRIAWGTRRAADVQGLGAASDRRRQPPSPSAPSGAAA